MNGSRAESAECILSMRPTLSSGLQFPVRRQRSSVCMKSTFYSSCESFPSSLYVSLSLSLARHLFTCSILTISSCAITKFNLYNSLAKAIIMLSRRIISTRLPIIIALSPVPACSKPSIPSRNDAQRRHRHYAPPGQPLPHPGRNQNQQRAFTETHSQSESELELESELESVPLPVINACVAGMR